MSPSVWQADFVGVFVLPALAFVLTVAVTKPLIGWLARNQLGKAIRADGPDHASKVGTPTMGGLGMLAVIAGLAGVALAWLTPDGGPQTGPNHYRPYIVATLFAMLGFGALGLVDDLAGLARRRGRRELGVGLTARRMLVLQAVVAVATVLYLDRAMPRGSTVGATGWISFAVLALVLVTLVNGVNLSDGLDGLAAGLLAIAFSAFGLIEALAFSVLLWIRATGDGEANIAHLPIVSLPLIIACGCLGFLVFNRHPARVLMGNVTSMALGGALGVLVLHYFYTSGPPTVVIPLFTLGIVFVAEVASDVIQIAYFKLSGGKRFFRMAPLHHHFELGGMSEPKVVRRFWAAGLVGALAYYATLLLIAYVSGR